MIIPERAENGVFSGFPGCVNPNTYKSTYKFYVGNFCAVMGILVDSEWLCLFYCAIKDLVITES